jgi:hypothetical protein
MARYVNIYKGNKENDYLGAIYNTRNSANENNLPARGQTSETVRILNEQEEKEFKAEIIEECKQELLNHLAEVIYRQNDYPIRAVPQATILSLYCYS